MRISDWSSDVCSSDLRGVRADDREAVLDRSPDRETSIRHRERCAEAQRTALPRRSSQIAVEGAEMTEAQFGAIAVIDAVRGRRDAAVAMLDIGADILRPDRKSVVSGKSVSVPVDLGGRRVIKRTNSKEIPLTLRENY